MPGDTVYRSSVPWDSARPDTVIISCADGRWRSHIQRFAQEYLKADAHADLLAVPGGIEPLTLFDLVPKDFNFLRRRLEALVQAHGTRRVVAIAHQDCTWYRAHRIGFLKLDLRERQVVDLRRVSTLLREMLPGIVVETYYASLEHGAPPRVIFESL